MRILYDGQVYRLQPYGGVKRYFVNLISRLPSYFEPCLIVDQSAKARLPQHAKLEIYRSMQPSAVVQNISYRGAGYFADAFNWLLSTRLSRKCDVLHPTYYDLITRRGIDSFGLPVVLTVWDMIHEIFQPQMDPKGEVAQLKRRAILASQRIICISENTKKDLLSWYSIPENIITVTPLAPDVDESLSHGPETVPSRPYYLYVGLRPVYKNFNGLLRAFAQAVSRTSDLALCVVGEPFRYDEISLVNELGIADHVEHYGYASDQHLAKLYRCSRALVYPSLYEGFGIPPLEAMACGTVAVVANAACLPEVVGEAGLLFDPQKLDDLTDILLLLLNDDSLRTQLVEKGRRRAEQFSWSRTVAQTVDVYRSLR